MVNEKGGRAPKARPFFAAKWEKVRLFTFWAFTYRGNYCKIKGVYILHKKRKPCGFVRRRFGGKMKPAYKRILLKLSGEALAGESKFGLDYPKVFEICKRIKTVAELDVQIGIVVGGGNFWRGRSGGQMDRTRADHMGMLATVINSLALCDALEQLGVAVRVQTAIAMQEIAEPYIRNKAEHHLRKNRVVIFGCGTGNPFFSTDTAAALRAAEIDAQIIMKATNVDGVYDCDPRTNVNAKKFDELAYLDILSNGLQVMDSTAASLCMDNRIPILVFNLDNPDNIVRAVQGENIGTIVR